MIKIKIAANITYGGSTFNTPLILEYEHTGTIYEIPNKKYTTNPEIYQNWIDKGIKARVKDGYYFIKRMAIPTINAKGEQDIWYINNSGDSYAVNKISKYGRKIHAELSKHQKPIKTEKP